MSVPNRQTGDRSSGLQRAIAPLWALVAALVMAYTSVRRRFGALTQKLGTRIEEEQTVAANTLANFAIGLLVTLIVVLVAALVGGEFANAIPSGSPFASAINTTTNTAGTAFTLFGVSLIVLPGVAVVSLIVRSLLRGNMGGGGGRM